MAAVDAVNSSPLPCVVYPPLPHGRSQRPRGRSARPGSQRTRGTAPRPWRKQTPDELLPAARANDPFARARLVDACMPRISGIARIYAQAPAVDRSELMQAGVLGMLRALERYDASFGTPFWAYASWWVRQAMQQVVSELSRPVVLSDRALRQLARVREARRSFTHAHAREPSTRELAEETRLTPGQLASLAAAERPSRALEEPVDSGSEARTFGETISDPRAEDAYEEVGARMGIAEIPRLLAQLSDRERRVVVARYGLRSPSLTLREVGDSLGISAERVRQIEQGALETMRLAYGGSRGCPPGGGVSVASTR